MAEIIETTVYRLDELSEEAKAELLSLILSTVTGVSAGLQNTG